MDPRTRELAAHLRSLPSGAAADWLLAHYPLETGNWAEGAALIGHRSWKARDIDRLARYYLMPLPFASARLYEIFLKAMPVDRFLAIVEALGPESGSRRSLLAYYVMPALRSAARTDADQARIDAFEATLAPPPSAQPLRRDRLDWPV